LKERNQRSERLREKKESGREREGAEIKKDSRTEVINEGVTAKYIVKEENKEEEEGK
jgi:hypothetical protein